MPVEGKVTMVCHALFRKSGSMSTLEFCKLKVCGLDRLVPELGCSYKLKIKGQAYKKHFNW